MIPKLWVRLTAWRTSRIDRPVQCEAGDVDDGLVAEVLRAEPGVEVEAEAVTPHAHHRGPPASDLALLEERAEGVGERVRFAHRITRRETHARDAAVGDCGAPVGREDVLLVGALRERIQGVTVAPVGEAANREAGLVAVVALARRGERHDHDRGDGEEPEERDRDREHALHPVEVQRAVRAAEPLGDLEQRAPGLERHPQPRRAEGETGDPDADVDGDERQRDLDHLERAPLRERHREAASGAHEEQHHADCERGLLDVESLHEMQHRGDGEERERQRRRRCGAAAPAPGPSSMRTTPRSAVVPAAR